MKIEAFTYEADTHCVNCAVARFGLAVLQSSDGLQDNEGNQPHPVFSTDEMERPICCGTCRKIIG